MKKPSEIKKDWLQACKVVKFIDGDSLGLVIDWGNNRRERLNLRIAGIDTPEKNAKDPFLKAKAFEAKDYVESLISFYTSKHGKWFQVKTYKPGKYGRMLGDVILPYSNHGGTDINVAESLLAVGLAIPYGEKWNEQK